MTPCIDKNQVRKHFSSHAQDYDRYAQIQLKVAKQLAGQLPASLPLCRRALEIGCGTGMLSRQVLNRQPDLPLVLTDLAHGMSRHVQQQFPVCPVCDTDAIALPFLAGSFDLVLSSSVYQWLNDLPGAFAEVARVLAPKGRFVVALFGEKTLYELRHAHQQALGNRHSHGQSFPGLERVADAAAGLFEIEVLRAEFEMEWHATVPDLLRNLKRIGAQNASQDRPQGLASRQVMQRMFACYQQQFGTDNGIPATYEVIYLSGQRK
ncbi:MAG TPA: methyltransferase domain-containing protein [Malonomonas sp.]